MSEAMVLIPGQHLLCGTEFLGQLVTLGYKNVRINEALFLQRGQHLILTGKFGYLMVKFHDIFTPEHTTLEDRLEGVEHRRKDDISVMFQLVVEPEKCFTDFRIRNLCYRTALGIPAMLSACPK